MLGVVTQLSANPRPRQCAKRAGASDLWRVRIGQYRVVYRVDDAARIVDVRIVAHRREVYRDV